ncbi:MAG TPA: hypothetical protein VKE22_28965 [Haliangiales bacterium]|nr:hypothetical protein [Haliangiales bacterium]
MQRVVPFCVLLLTVSAWARKPEDVFAGKILVSDKPYPTAARSPDAFIDAAKKQSRDRFQEDKEAKEWRVFFAAFFRQPMNDLEISIRIYDVTNGERLVETFEQYLPSRGQRAYLSSLTLKRGDGSAGYDPNSKVRIVMDSRGKVLADTTIFLIGEARKYSGKVDFSEDEKK